MHHSSTMKSLHFFISLFIFIFCFDSKSPIYFANAIQQSSVKSNFKFQTFSTPTLGVKKSFAIIYADEIFAKHFCSILNILENFVCHGDYVGKSLDSIEEILVVPLRKVDIAMKFSGLNVTALGMRNKRESGENDFNMTRNLQIINEKIIGFQQSADQVWPSLPILCNDFNMKLIFIFNENILLQTIEKLIKLSIQQELQAKVEAFQNSTKTGLGPRAKARELRRQAVARRQNAHVHLTNATLETPLVIDFVQFMEQLDHVRRSHALLQWLWQQTPPSCRFRLNGDSLRSNAAWSVYDVVKFLSAPLASVESLQWPLETHGIELPTQPDLSVSIANYHAFVSQLKMFEPDLMQYL